MKKALKRLKSKRGETLIETMAAILIFTLSSVMLYSMLTSASGINSTVQDAQAVNQADIQVIEQQTGGDSGEVTIRFDDTDKAEYNVPVIEYHGANYYSYSPAPAADS